MGTRSGCENMNKRKMFIPSVLLAVFTGFAAGYLALGFLHEMWFNHKLANQCKRRVEILYAALEAQNKQLRLPVDRGCFKDASGTNKSGTNLVSGCSEQLAVPMTADNKVDWAATRVTLSDSEIAHFHKRAKDIINDDSLWKRLGQKYEGPFELRSEDFKYECARLANNKATVAVIVPIKKPDFPHAWFVRIVFRQYFTEKSDQEVESIDLGYY